MNNYIIQGNINFFSELMNNDNHDNDNNNYDNINDNKNNDNVTDNKDEKKIFNQTNDV